MTATKTMTLQPSAVDALAQALGITDRGLARVLTAFGFDQTCAPLVAWIPAIELAWIGGLTAPERHRLLGLVHGRHGVLDPRAEVLLRRCLARRPAHALFRAARRVLRAQLEALPPDERPALRARVIGPCTELAQVSGGLLGLAAVSEDEQDWLLALADDLRLPEEQRHTESGGVS